MMMPFDPFQDRLSRDIRNDLSATILTVLEQQDPGPVQKVADWYLAQELAPHYREYILDRLVRYRSALAQTKKDPPDLFRWGVILWDQGLFFEVHEVLEHAWRRADGSEKKILQAMIRAAGVYIKLEQGNAGSARKMADRALPVLTRQKAFLARYFDPEPLLHALHNLTSVPPRLVT